MIARPRAARSGRLLRAVAVALLVVAAAGAGFVARVEPSEAAWVAADVNAGNSVSTKASWSVPLYSWGYGANGRTGALLMSGSTSTAVRATGPEQWSSVAAGLNTTCALTTSGALFCWGYNGEGQIGDGSQTDREEAVAVAAGTTWSKIANGPRDTCAIRASDSVLHCWGYDVNGQVGDGSTASSVTTPTPVSTGAPTSWSTVTVGDYFACGIKTDGTLWCWGYNDHGQLGQNDTTQRTVPTKVGAATTWRTVNAGGTSVCGTRTDDTLWCWGDRGLGQVGDGATSPDAAVPQQVGTGYATTSAGLDRHCGLRTDGTIWCWGYGGHGGLGDNSTADESSPVQESSHTTTWTSLASMAYATCATRNTGALYCWGQNASGQLGDGTTTDRWTPVASGSATDWTAVEGGYDSLCGVRSADSSLWCQGGNGYWVLGHYDSIRVGSPTPLMTGSAASTDWIAGDAGFEGGCGIRSDRTLWCWGDNTNATVGAGDTGTDHPTPTQEAGGYTDWTQVSVGSWHVCGLRGTAMYCWGDAGHLQYGTGDPTSSAVPVPGAAGAWTSVSAGEENTCGIMVDGTLWCWGANTLGQLGQGDTNFSGTPVPVTAAGVTTWASVSAGYYAACAIAATGSAAGGLFCWGDNDQGQVGDGDWPTNATSPVRVGAGTWTKVSVGRQHACGLTTGGAVECWGLNDSGQLGQDGVPGAPDHLDTPHQVGPVTSYTDVTAAWGVSCAVRNDKTLWCWGRDDGGQLGDRNSSGAAATTPQQVPGTTALWVSSHASALTLLASTAV